MSENGQEPKQEFTSRKQQREKKKFDYERNNRTIFVGNLPASYTHQDVAKLFKSCGPIESARIRSIVPDKEKLAPKVAMITKRIHPKIDAVNAYVVFDNNDDDVPMKRALALNGRKIDGHHIRVDRASKPNAKHETLTSRKKSIFVGNLRFDIREDDLINHFNKIGPVNYVRLVRDRATGLGKGFGFVVFNERVSVKKALELNETNFKGRSLRIKKVEEEEEKKMKKEKTKKDETAESDCTGDENLDEDVRPAKSMKSSVDAEDVAQLKKKTSIKKNSQQVQPQKKVKFNVDKKSKFRVDKKPKLGGDKKSKFNHKNGKPNRAESRSRKQTKNHDRKFKTKKQKVIKT